MTMDLPAMTSLPGEGELLMEMVADPSTRWIGHPTIEIEGPPGAIEGPPGSVELLELAESRIG